MAWRKVFLDRLRALRDNDVVHRDIDEEMRFHIEMRTEDNVRRGMEPEEARRDAERRFGRLTRIKEMGYEVRGGGMLETLWQDLRFGARMLRRSPSFTTVVVLSLALSIGANTAIFSVVNAVLLRPLPYERPEQLVGIYDSLPSLGFPRTGLSEAEFVRLRDETRSFAEVAAWYWGVSTLRGAGEPDRVIAPLASANFFRALGVEVVLGRGFNPEEELVGKNNVVVLSHSFWQRRFAGDPTVIGQAVTLDDASFTVIGVLPASFKAPPELKAEMQIDLWRGYDLNPARLRRGSQFLSVIGRLRPGVTIAEAQSESYANTRREATEFPSWYPPDIFNSLEPLERSIVGDVRSALLILLASVAVVLLIGCANVANLLLVKGDQRQKEIAVRVALGASRGRIIRQLLIESLLLAVLGGAGGLLLARWGLVGLLAIGPDNIPRLAETSLDLRVIGFALLVSLLTAVIFGLAPALHAVEVDLHSTLKEGGRGAGQMSHSRLRRSLVVLETALAFVLLVGAGLLIRSFWKLQHVNTGFRTDHLLTMRLTPPGSGYGETQQIASLYERLISRINALPGVESAAVTDPLPLSGANEDTIVEIEGRPFDMNRLTHMSVDFRTVSPAYFQTMNIQLMRGRLFTDADREGALAVAVVNETFARNHWPGEEAVGKRFRYMDGPPDRATTRFLTITGVVADTKNRTIDVEARQEAFIPLSQHGVTYGGAGPRRAFNLVVRTIGDPMSLAASLQREVRSVERDFIITQVRTMEQLFEKGVVQPRFNMILLAIFALLALGLGAVGLYGVVAYTVTQRTHEFGIRMALGAQRSDVIRLVLGEGITLVAVGVVLGLIGAVVMSQLLVSFLYGVSPVDWVAYISAAALLAIVAFVANLIPAQRALKVDPLIALRYE